MKFTPSPNEPNIVFFGSDFKEENFTLLQFHFHWGENDYHGSEHYLNDNKYSAEAIFFKNII